MDQPTQIPGPDVRPPAVSVIIPTWNGERYIGETLASVLAQTFQDHEILVVDDGSTDGTHAVLEPHRSRLRYLFQPNEGQSSARNRGAAQARGEYLAFLDHDDRWEPDYLEKMIAYLRCHPEVGLLMAGVRLMTAGGEPTPRIIRKRQAGDSFTTRSLLEGEVGSIRNPVIRAEVFRRSGGYDEAIRGPEDCDLWLRISFLTPMRYLPEPLLLYRTHPGNFSKNYLDNARQWLRLLDKFEAEHPDFAREHVELLRRNRAKQLLRLGRELFAGAGGDRGRLAEAREALGRAIALDPSKTRARVYRALTFVPGAARLYARWRLRERAARQRLFRSRVLARLSEARAPGAPRRS